MDKNSITGLVLIGVILFGFSWYQSKQYDKQLEWQAQADSLARAQADSMQRVADAIALEEALARQRADSALLAEHPELADSLAAARKAAETELSQAEPLNVIYRDSSLTSRGKAEASVIALENDKVKVEFTTRGAQVHSAWVKDFMAYGDEDADGLYLIKPEDSRYSVDIYAGEAISTEDFVFDVVESCDTALVMRLPFSNGGYIEQRYSLEEGSYSVKNMLSFVGLREQTYTASNFSIRWNAAIPRLEKGLKNEKRYSKLNYHFPDEKKVENLGMSGRDANKSIGTQIEWVDFQQQFFSAILTAGDNFQSGDLAVKFTGDDEVSGVLMECSASMKHAYEVSDNVQIPLEFYFGPNHYKTLKAYDRKYEKVIPLGGSLVGWISRWIIIPTFDLLSRWISNFGVIILIMTILLKLIISPLTMKSYKSSAMMNVLKPEIQKINEKYPKQEDAMKKQQATMDLYNKAGVSPMGGCLPLLFQFPILWAMFRFFPASIELRQQPFLWADDLSAYDSILDFGFKIPLYGDHISLFALLMAIVMFFYSKMSSQQMSDDPSMAAMKFMSVWLMPIMMLCICNDLSSALSYYYLLSNIITMGQTWFIKKFMIDEDKIRAKIAAAANSKAPARKSKFQMRLEAMQKAQEQQMKEQQKRKR
ncbi:MAG: membrane protein insertase YidC [Bacteroidales bacterium]|nr:membrane protein insertase YidC [Bacteroidales bacterium]